MSISELFCEKSSLYHPKFSTLASADYLKPSMSNSDFGELVWENGQIVIKGGHFINSKTGNSGNSFGLGVEDIVGRYDDVDAIPWFYHLDDMLHHGSASGVLAESSGVTSNGHPSCTNFSAAHKLSNPVKDLNASTLPNSGSRVSRVAGKDVPKYAIKSDSLRDQLSEMRLQKKQDTQVQAANFTLYRHVAGSKNNSESVGARATNDRLLTHGTAAAKDGMLVEANGLTTDVTKKCLPGEHVEEQANAMLGEDGLKLNQGNVTNAHIASIGGKKIIEPTAAPPSPCSDNSGFRASNNPTMYLKRKHNDEEDCKSSSEDTEEESISIRKVGCKRKRAAEVHNSMERKRREKINNKMRALQELIPNCNKVDKATMLDDAINYMRVLQFQVQMMSMRSQMCPTPIMQQPGLQHLRAQTHIQQFMPMGFGMGHGYQAGALDTSPGFSAQATLFPGPSNPRSQLWNTAQGIPVSMPVPHGLSVPMPGARPTLIRGSAVENPNSKDPHLA